ncbi:MAG TPA: SRPBCC domain-containing protein [Terriglobia bacterium]|nr:SRPBCC domain-containing protein [Terriglobia bacterium]
MSIRAAVDLKLAPASAFVSIVEELSLGLQRLGMRFVPGVGGRVSEGAREVGRVVRWEPAHEIAMEWPAPEWLPGNAASLALRFEPIEGGTRVTVEQSGWEDQLGDKGNEMAGVPEEHLALFKDSGSGQLLVARRE